MNDDNPGRRGATKIDGKLPTCAQKARPKPQIAAARRLTGWSGPSEAIGGLPNATNRRMVGLRKPANGESRLKREAEVAVPRSLFADILRRRNLGARYGPCSLPAAVNWRMICLQEPTSGESRIKTAGSFAGVVSRGWWKLAEVA